MVGSEDTSCDGCNAAWIWDQVNGRRSIGTILTTGGIDLSDWEYLIGATSVSADGALIVGSGRGADGLVHGWLLNLALTPTIDIDPAKDPNIINLKSGGFVPVAILTNGTFDALQVDPETAKFGPDQAGIAHYKVRDLDKDGNADLVLYFRVPQTGIACSDTQAMLTGKLYDGITAFAGNDSIQTKNCQ